MLRSIAALVVGFLSAVVLAFGAEFTLITIFHREPVNDSDREPIMLFILLVTTAASAAVGGYSAASVAGRRPRTPALGLGALILLADIPLALTYWRNEPSWYFVGVLSLLLPATALGGWMFPHIFGSVYTAREANVFRRNAVFLPLYQLMLLFVFFVGFAAVLRVP